MLIGEVARRAGVSRDTVRLYTRLGLLPCRTVAAGSREYADYAEDVVQLVQDIQVAKSLGFTLTEIRPIAQLYLSGELDPSRQRTVLTAKLADIERKQQLLQDMAATLRAKLADLDHDSAG